MSIFYLVMTWLESGLYSISMCLMPFSMRLSSLMYFPHVKRLQLGMIPTCRRYCHTVEPILCVVVEVRFDFELSLTACGLHTLLV